MNLLELKEIIDNEIELHSEFFCKNITVGIPNNKPSWGGTSYTEVKSATAGFDWDANIFFINPEKTMKETTLKDKLEDL